MTTLRQIEANRRNAEHSTGPKTDEGKAECRQHAMKHGLAAQVLVPTEYTEKFQERLDGWIEVLAPEDVVQGYHVNQAVLASMRVERCQGLELERMIELSKVAQRPQWDQDREVEASDLGATLKRNPARVCLSLERTPAGRAWMIKQWKNLMFGVTYIARSHWSETETNTAMDLMGIPRTLRQAMVVLQSRFRDCTQIQALILGEIERLESLQVDATEENATLREQHRRGVGVDQDTTLMLQRRYEAAAHRQLAQSMKIIEKAKAAAKSEELAKSAPPAKPARVEVAAPVAEIKLVPIPTPELPAQPAEAAQPAPASEPVVTGNRLYRRQRGAKARHAEYLARRVA